MTESQNHPKIKWFTENTVEEEREKKNSEKQKKKQKKKTKKKKQKKTLFFVKNFNKFKKNIFDERLS